MTKSKVKKLGGSFVGGVSAAVFGLVFVVLITDLETKAENPMGVALVDLLPSVIVSVFGAVFLVYVIGLVSGRSET